MSRASIPTVNADLGEGFGLHSFGHDEALMGIVDLVNIACGFHAGDPDVMSRTVALAAHHGVRVGSHPGLPDLTGFGRRRMALSPDQVESLIRYQTGALIAFLEKENLPLHHIKPHGALYGMLSDNEALMEAAAKVAAHYKVAFLGLAGTAHETVCTRYEVQFIPELYVDLNYDDQGTLVIQHRVGGTDPAAAAGRVANALEGRGVESLGGTQLDIVFDSVCVHSDAPNSVAVATAVRSVLPRQKE